MSNDKQSSSIDFFWNQLPEILPFTVNTEIALKLLEAFEQAKAMHKQEIEDAWDKGDYCIDLPDGTWEQKYKSAEHYYNETFGGNDEQ